MTMTLIMAAVGVLSLGGLVAVFCAARTAPAGYQDDAGFHLGAQSSERADDQRLENPS